MGEDANNRSQYARVFLSYARADGQEFARELRTRLEGEHISLWQDRMSMEGGRDWWLQIVEALNHVEFMVLVMTPAAVQSPIVRKEWRYARQQGVCVYPVKGPFPIDFACLPRWMREVHWYDLEFEWTKFVHDLERSCEQPRVPFMVEELPEDFVPRPQEFESLIGLLLDEQREEPVAITTALRGAGGYGKTTLARALCHDERIQEAFDDGILWVTLGEDPGSLLGKVEDLISILSRERFGFEGIDAAMARLAELLTDRDILLVIDDVWNAAHLRPFLHGGNRCARLITTRDEGVLPRVAQRIQVDAMQPDQAIQLLSAGLSPASLTTGATQSLRQLAQRLGEWPLLLTLVNSALTERVQRGQRLTDALLSIQKTLEKRGLTAFDAHNAQERHQAVKKTLGVSFDLLSANDAACYRELAIFPEDVDIPLVTLQRLWGTTAGLDELDTEEVCERLYRFSLLLRYDLAAGTIRLHDVMRTYLQQEPGGAAAALHGQLLDAYQCGRWADLPAEEPYLWEHLAYHLLGAGRVDDLIKTVTDLRYLITKTYVRHTAYRVEMDLRRAEEQVNNRVIHVLRRSVATVSHLLNQCVTWSETACTLVNHLYLREDVSSLCEPLLRDLSRPFLLALHPLPDGSHPALVRTLQGHTDSVTGCAYSPDGRWIVSSSADRTLKVWDASSGQERLSLQGHTREVTGCAYSPDGRRIVSSSADRTLKVWDASSGQEYLSLQRHIGRVTGCAYSPDGRWIVSASTDRTLKVWDASSGKVRLSLQGHTRGVTGCAYSPDGRWIVSASADNMLKVWEASSGQVRLRLQGHIADVTGCAYSPDGRWIVSVSYDNTLKVWEASSGQVRPRLQGHTRGVTGCAYSPDGRWIVSASYDRTLKVWEASSGQVRLSLQGHTREVNGCAYSPDGRWIVSASADNTLKVWEASSGQVRLDSQGHTADVTGCAYSPDGRWIVSASYDNTLKVWEASSGQVRLSLQGHTADVRGCAYSPDGRWIVSASTDRTLKVWEASSGKVRLSLQGHIYGVNGCAYSPDGRRIVSASDDNMLKVWEASSGQVRLSLQGHTDSVTGCAYSPDGRWIVSASADNTLKVWEASSGQVRLSLQGHTSWVTGCAYSPDGRWIVSASKDRTLKVWETSRGQERLSWQGHSGVVTRCAYSPDGRRIVSASDDGTLKVWDAHNGDCRGVLRVEGSLLGCAFSPQGATLLACGAAGLYFLRLLE